MATPTSPIRGSAAWKRRSPSPRFGKTALDAVNVRLNLRGGVAELESADIAAGENRVALRAKVNLPAQMADLVRATGQGNLRIAVPDFSRLPVALPVELAGSLNAGGDFTLADGTFKLDSFKGHVQSLAATGATGERRLARFRAWMPPRRSRRTRPRRRPLPTRRPRRRIPFGMG